MVCCAELRIYEIADVNRHNELFEFLCVPLPRHAQTHTRAGLAQATVILLAYSLGGQHGHVVIVCCTIVYFGESAPRLVPFQSQFGALTEFARAMPIEVPSIGGS